MGVLGRWLALEFVKAYVALAFSVALLFLVIDGLVNLHDLAESGEVWNNAWRRYAHMLPELFYTLSPFLTLLGTLWVIANLRRTNQLVPLAAAGYAPRQIAAPLLAMALFSAPLCWIDREVLLPQLSDLRRADRLDHSSFAVRPMVDASGCVLSGHAYSVVERRIHEARYVAFDSAGGERFSVLSKEADAAPEGWIFRHGVALTRAPPGEAELITAFGAEGYLVRTTIGIEDVEAMREAPMYLSAAQLKRQIERTPAFKHLAVQYYERYAQPLAGLVLLLVSIPLVLDIGEGALPRFFASLLLAMGYFMISTVCFDLGRREELPPALAAFLPLIICGTAGGVLLWRKR